MVHGGDGGEPREVCSVIEQREVFRARCSAVRLEVRCRLVLFLWKYDAEGAWKTLNREHRKAMVRIKSSAVWYWYSSSHRIFSDRSISEKCGRFLTIMCVVLGKCCRRGVEP